MKVTYTTESIVVDDPSKTLFLAGPSPRGSELCTWRPTALHYLEQLNNDIHVFNPEQRTPGCIDFSKVDYPADWEHQAIAKSRVLIFWVPRDLKDLPGFTTNIEFGYFIDKFPAGHIFYGRPENAPKTKYLDFLWNKVWPQQPIYERLDVMLDNAMKTLQFDPSKTEYYQGPKKYERFPSE